MGRCGAGKGPTSPAPPGARFADLTAWRLFLGACQGFLYLAENPALFLLAYDPVAGTLGNLRASGCSTVPKRVRNLGRLQQVHGTRPANPILDRPPGA